MPPGKKLIGPYETKWFSLIIKDELTKYNLICLFEDSTHLKIKNSFLEVFRVFLVC